MRQNPVNDRLIERLPQLDLPDCHLVGGCLFQTVWNCLSGNRPGEHILDYDLFYFDPTDLSWEAEDAAIGRARRVLGELGGATQIRNQARVHLWYSRKFGIACAPLRSTEDGIDHFLSQSCCFGVRHGAGAPQVYAPHGFADLFSMTVRPNSLRDLPEVYHQKTSRWTEAWPGLQVIPARAPTPTGSFAE